MLGVPLGSDAYTTAKVAKKLNDSKTSKIMEELSDWDDTQAAFHLLKTSFSSVKATHFMAEEASKFDERMRVAAQTIIGIAFEPDQWNESKAYAGGALHRGAAAPQPVGRLHRAGRHQDQGPHRQVQHHA
jgi:hypothetical protein